MRKADHTPFALLIGLASFGCSAAQPSPDEAPPPAATVSAAASASASAAPAQDGPPPTPMEPVTEVYFGTKVVDPYRWMEKLDSPPMVAWLKAQADYTGKILGALPERPGLLARIAELDKGQAEAHDLQTWGKRWFYTKLPPGGQSRSLFVRDALGPAGAERVLVDPDKLPHKPGEHITIDFFFPSPNGKLVAYGASPGGSEKSVLYVVEVETGKQLSEAIDRTSFTVVTWLDDRTFLYPRLQKVGPDAPPGAMYQKVRAYLHTVGQDPERDKVVFGYDVYKDIPFHEDEYPWFIDDPTSDRLLALVALGVKKEVSVYVGSKKKLTSDHAPWVKAADSTRDVPVDAYVRGKDLYLLTHKDAPRFKVLKTSADKPDLARAEVLIPEGKGVINAIALGQDALYAAVYQAGIEQIHRLPFKGAREVIDLPRPGTTRMMTANPRAPGVVVQNRIWTAPPAFVAYDPAAKKFIDAGLIPTAPSGVELVSVEVECESADGTKVPLSIVHKKGLEKDGARPTWLDGYGAYGFTRPADYAPARGAWFERGGVYAVCHPRGGGEYGEGWHQDGMLQNKVKGVADYLACADHLVKNGYTSRNKLVAYGKSAGGVLIGGALNARPDGFGAVVFDVAETNSMRAETTPGGPPNIPEFGTFKTEEGFRALMAQDAYLGVKEGTAYPPVLLLTGANDPRVVSWMPAKMTARLRAATSSKKPVLLRVDYDAGHGSFGSTREQRHAEMADVYAFLLWQLGGERR